MRTSVSALMSAKVQVNGEVQSTNAALKSTLKRMLMVRTWFSKYFDSWSVILSSLKLKPHFLFLDFQMFLYLRFLLSSTVVTGIFAHTNPLPNNGILTLKKTISPRIKKITALHVHRKLARARARTHSLSHTHSLSLYLHASGFLETCAVTAVAFSKATTIKLHCN